MGNLPTILIVDDNEENLLLLDLNIKKLNVNLIKALSGEEALEKSHGIDIALAIVDVRMPQMSGFEFAMKLNEKRQTDKVPVIFLTANYYNEVDVFEGYDSGAVDYIYKPLNSRILLSKIRVFIDLFNQKQTIKKDLKLLKESADKLIKVNTFLKKSEEKYRSYIDNAPDGIFISDETGRFIEVNNALCELIGFSEDEFLNMSVSNFCREKAIEEYMAQYQKIVKTGALKIDLLCKHKNGSEKWLAIEIVKLAETRFLGFAKDITSRIELEGSLRSKQQDLEIQNSELSVAIQTAQDAIDLYDFSPSGFFTVSETGEIIRLNLCGAQMLGKKRSILQNNLFRFFVSDDTKTIFDQFLKNIYNSKINVTCEVTILPDSNNPISVHLTGNLTKNVEHCLITMVDISRRKRVEEDLLREKLMMSSLIDSLPGIFYLYSYPEMRLIRWNKNHESLFKFNTDKLFGWSVYDWHPSEVKDSVLKTLETVFKNGYLSTELLLNRKDGLLVPFMLISVRIDFQDQTYIMGVGMDITDRKQAEDLLRMSERNLAEAQQIAHIGSWERDMANNTIKWSEEIFRVLDIDSQSFDGKMESLVGLIHPDDSEIFNQILTNHLSDEKSKAIEFRIIHKNGSVHNILAKIRIEYDEAGKPFRSIGTMQDITERKQSEKEKSELEQLQLLTKYTEKAIENERKLISRELHDDLGQALTAVKIDLSIIKQQISENEVINKIIKVSALVGETIKAVQRITAQLRPEIIDDLGLEAAIGWYTKEFSQRNNIEIILNIDRGLSISSDASLVLFRILQESLTNVARHAQASRVEIKLIKMGKFIHFQIADNGVGISENELKSKKSFGIIGMNERSSLLGGTFEIFRGNSKGTVIKLNFPIDN